jgi:subtilisin family serine protease
MTPESLNSDSNKPILPQMAEVITRFKSEAGVRLVGAELTSIAGANLTNIKDRLARMPSLSLRRLFDQTEATLLDQVATVTAAAGIAVPDLSLYYTTKVAHEEASKLVEDLAKEPLVDAVYIKPPTEPAGLFDNDLLTLPTEAPPVTPDFVANQEYLNPAPKGVDAKYAWIKPGGTGADVNIIDIEGEWRFTHEDLLLKLSGVIGGTPPNDLGWRNHGTAVAGEISADHNNMGINGICPDAMFGAISIFGTGQGSANAIKQAADHLNAGDIILIELHRPGPRYSFQLRDDQKGFIAVEWWPDDFDAIKYATAKGVLVVEAAGNGAENLDDAIYNNPDQGFPADWTNPFNRSNRDSGAIIVGAGAPPPGTHGANYGPDRSRLDFSNYGALVDAQGWGREVTSTGYGDLQGGSDENKWYTNHFSGTSSASPIVVGAMGCCQGALKAAGRSLLTPANARNLLRTTGSPQTDAPGMPATQRIGNRPNLKAMFSELLLNGDESPPRKGCFIARWVSKWI